jgi:hypothetical protein
MVRCGQRDFRPNIPFRGPQDVQIVNLQSKFSSCDNDRDLASNAFFNVNRRAIKP